MRRKLWMFAILLTAAMCWLTFACATGDGSVQNLYQIGSVEEYNDFAAKVNDDEANICAVLTADLRSQMSDQRAPHGFVAENIIRCNTGLTAVKELTKHNAFCRKLYFCSSVNNTRAFSTKLQHNGSQMLCGVTKHFLTNRLASGKENEVKFLFK